MFGLRNVFSPLSRTFLVAKGLLAKKRGGFTLVELIVVITILAVLATIGFLALQGYTQDAKDTVIKANVRSVSTAVASESASSGNSPRYYVVYDASAALSGAVAYFDGSNPVILTGGDWNQPNTNYSAGNPDYAKLRMNAEKFKTAYGPDSAFFDTAFAAYDPKYLTLWAADGSLVWSNGRRRAVSYFQAAGVSPTTSVAVVAGNFQPSPSGGTSGLIRNLGSASLTGALSDGVATGGVSGASSSSSGGGGSTYPGCDTADITLANGQIWAACNAGATTAYAGQAYPVSTAPTWAQQAYLWAFYQWGRNDDVTVAGTPTSAQATAGTLAGGVGHSNFITNGPVPYDWIATQNDNLWGGGSTSAGIGYYTGQTVGNQAMMKGPCQSWYHVPTQAEWFSAISTINGGLTNSVSWQNDTTLVTTLKLPFSGFRYFSSAAYFEQGSGGGYWASSPTGTSAHYVRLSTTQVVVANQNARAYGFSVRCLKN